MSPYALVLYARAPRLGAVKTRLVPPLDPREALALHVALLEDSLALLRGAARRAAAAPYLSVSEGWDPDDASLPRSLARAAARLDRLPQRGAHLGERLRSTFEQIAARGHAAALVIGSDSPTLPGERIETAFGRLRSGWDVVIVPAEDGGYCLIGARRPPPGIFEGIDWGTGRVLGQTLDACARAGARAAVLPPWHDVDRPEDLDRLRRELLSPCGAGPGRPARRTAAVLARLGTAGRL